jgi:L-serine/L-threonine ammonia-lyase
MASNYDHIPREQGITTMPLHIETPVMLSRPLSALSNKSVWLKFESMQPSGSFKIRGVGAVCEGYARQGKKQFVSSSGGNAGIAVAYAGRQLAIPVTVVVPETTTPRAKALIELEGASVIVHGASWMEANDLAQSMLDDPSVAFVHPFDNPVMWSGHATMIDEVVSKQIPFDSVILSVGGGGLFSGVMEGLQRHGLTHIPVLAMETTGAASLTRSMETGFRVELEAIKSVATSLGAKMVCKNAFEMATRYGVRCEVVEDIEALEACENFLVDHRTLVEPACGASLAAVYSHEQRLISDFDAPLVIVCGGATATPEQIRRWRNVLEEASQH